jgi:outer membrane receptor protein involved in Fe transport
VRRTEIAVAAVGICWCAGSADAAPRRHFQIPPAPLSDALIQYGEQAGVTLGLTDPSVIRAFSTGVHGTLSPRRALARLLADTGCGFVWLDAQTVRIVPLRVHNRTMRHMPGPVADAELEAPDIVVTATKQESNLADYPGGAVVLALDREESSVRTAQGIGAVLARSPSISSTSLGPGRDKLFIRGIADSSFTGPTEATVGQYLGDVRLTYNAPDPDLNLYDVQRIELLEGPQNTLYGTGALGGIIRIVPNQPDPDKTAASFQAGLLAVSHGDFGGDAAAMANVPISEGVAARMVGYLTRDPGYIDDPQRAVSNINRGHSYGGRFALRLAPAESWTVDLGATIQNIATRDGQYAVTGLPPLTRNSALAQPFDNDYALLSVTIRKSWNDIELVSATGYVHHDVGLKFDATPASGSPVRLFDEDDHLFLLSHETRLSGHTDKGIDWLAGVAGTAARDRIRRSLGPVGALLPITGVRNDNFELSLFGRGQVPITDELQLTGGGRLTYSEATGFPLDTPHEEDKRKRRAWRISPSAALSWHPSVKVRAFLSYDEGYRAGGLAVAASGGTETTQSFRPDHMSAFQLGARFGDAAVDRLAWSVILSRTRWTHIQADLIDRTGLPYTANIGSGKVDGIEASTVWSPLTGLKLSFAAFLNDDALSHPAQGIALRSHIDLPNVADLGIAGAVSYRTRIGGERTLALDASVRRAGRSRLGPPPDLYIAQGRYWDATAGARVGLGRFGVSLDVTNLFDGRGNRFSYGNPFSVRMGNQVTPLRPRSVRLGFDGHF